MPSSLIMIPRMIIIGLGVVILPMLVMRGQICGQQGATKVAAGICPSTSKAKILPDDTHIEPINSMLIHHAIIRG
jgi:hypothetical protein